MADIFTETRRKREADAGLNGDKTPAPKQEDTKPTMSQAEFSGYGKAPTTTYDRKKAQAAAEGRIRLNTQDKKY